MKIKFKVLGKSWTLKLLSKEKYLSKKARRDSVAISYLHKRKVYLSPAGVDFETITHELVHAFYYEMCVHSTSMDDDSVEEFFAELISKRGQEILDLGKKLKLAVDKLSKNS